MDLLQCEAHVHEMSKAWLNSRNDSYLSNNYLVLHNTVVSVTLAVAGIAAGNLFVVPNELLETIVLLRVLWFVSLLATLVAYAGAATGAGLLPRKIPGIADLLLPLLIGVAECLMFGVLARQAAGLVEPSAVLAVWHLSLGFYGTFAGLAVLRARTLFNPSGYARDVRGGIDRYRKGLAGDAVAAFTVGVIGHTLGILYALHVAVPSWVQFGVIALIAMGMFTGLYSHDLARRSIHETLESNPSTADITDQADLSLARDNTLPSPRQAADTNVVVVDVCLTQKSADAQVLPANRPEKPFASEGG